MSCSPHCSTNFQIQIQNCSEYVCQSKFVLSCFPVVFSLSKQSDWFKHIWKFVKPCFEHLMNKNVSSKKQILFFISCSSHVNNQSWILNLKGFFTICFFLKELAFTAGLNNFVLLVKTNIHGQFLSIQKFPLWWKTVSVDLSQV